MFIFFLDLPRIYIQNHYGLFYDGALQSEIRDPFFILYIVYQGNKSKNTWFFYLIYMRLYIVINMCVRM